MERAAPALRRRGRLRHERLCAGCARAGRRGQRLRRYRRPLPGAPRRRRRPAGADRSSRREPAGGGGRGARLLLGGGGGERRAARGARAGHPRAAPRGAAGRADGDETHDRGRGHPRQDDHRLDARARAARGRHAAGLAGGGADRGRPGQRGMGGGRVAGGGGGRVRPLDAQPERRDRGPHQRRARAPRDVRVAGAAAGGLPRVPRRATMRRGLGPARAAGAARGAGRCLRRARADAHRGRLAL